MAIEQKALSSLNRGEILAALDYEIASIEKEQSSPGWSKWTFYGGFATLVWVAIAEAAKNDFTIANAALILLLCSIFADLAEFSVMILSPRRTRPSEANRFRLFSQHFAGSRLSLLGAALRISALLGAYYFLRKSALQYFSGSFVWLYSILLILLLLICILSYSSFPINLRDRGPPWFNCTINLFVFVPLSVAFYDAGSKLLVTQSLFTVSDFRLGLLATVFLWLVPVSLNHVTQNQPLLETLKSVRRDLAFDRIDTNAALRQADIALDGMKVEDYFQSDLQKILRHLDSASKSMRELQDRRQEACSLVQGWEHTPPITAENVLPPSKMLRAILESCDLHRKAMTVALEAGKAARTAYSKRKPYVKSIVDASEIAKIDANIDSFIERLKKQAATLDTQEKILQDGLVKLAKHSPHLLPEPRPEPK